MTVEGIPFVTRRRNNEELTYPAATEIKLLSGLNYYRDDGDKRRNRK